MQLTRPDNVTKNKIIFNDAKEYKVKDSKIKYKRIKIETVYLNGKKGDLVIETPFLFSFGVNEKKSQETNKLVGYSIPVCLWEKDCCPSSPEKQFYEFICKMVEVCKEHLEEEYGADLASSMSESLYYKQIEYTDKRGKKKTKRDPSAAPVLYAKRIYSDKTKKILSLFRTKGKQKVNPFDYLNQYCYVKMALVIEGIYMSKTVTCLQIKIHECYVKPLKARESLLTIKESDEERSKQSEGEEGNESDNEKGSEDDNIGDLIISDKEEEVTE